MKEIDWIRGADIWLQTFFRVRDRAIPIIDKVSTALDSVLQEEKFAAFSEALEKLPPILESLKTAPELEGVNMKKLHRVQKLEVEALSSYIKACEEGVKLREGSTRAQYSAMMSQFSRASSYWDSSKKEKDALFKK